MESISNETVDKICDVLQYCDAKIGQLEQEVETLKKTTKDFSRILKFVFVREGKIMMEQIHDLLHMRIYWTTNKRKLDVKFLGTSQVVQKTKSEQSLFLQVTF